eukprot:CAMPEP_0117523172 /NCGR_PEP_ID=MMETSP0784-20121206/34591_1 /TAXON_ID=39447 /ORGANISM="" /LENGTH=181 /DNA_ID=CAMNT_0005319277 /DNA_START=76 /DNA_END=621 /DNA_ORIENTATION=-
MSAPVEYRSGLELLRLEGPVAQTVEVPLGIKCNPILGLVLRVIKHCDQQQGLRSAIFPEVALTVDLGELQRAVGVPPLRPAPQVHGEDAHIVVRHLLQVVETSARLNVTTARKPHDIFKTCRQQMPLDKPHRPVTLPQLLPDIPHVLLDDCVSVQINDGGIADDEVHEEPRVVFHRAECLL